VSGRVICRRPVIPITIGSAYEPLITPSNFRSAFSIFGNGTKKGKRRTAPSKMSADMSAPPTLDPEYDDWPQNTKRRSVPEGQSK